MFGEKDIMEFIKRIIEKESDEEKVIELINDFKETLILTKMANAKTLAKIDSIIEKLPGYYEMNKLLNDDEPKKLTRKKKVEDRHYDSYHSTPTTSYSNACGGGGTVYSSRC